MTKFNLIIALVFTTIFFKAQNVITTPQAYDAMKKAGKLNPKVKYRFIDSKSQSNKINTPASEAAFSPMTAATTTLGACQCMVPLDPSFIVVPFVGYSAPDYRCDDASSPLIPLGFNFCFYGTTYTSCYINSNGNITFTGDNTGFSSTGFPIATTFDAYDMVAPFWADVDTRNLGSGLIYYKQTATSLIVKWSTVGYYSNMADKTNDFQLIITDGVDPILSNSNNVAFCFGDMQWTTGSASGGTGGFGGTAATTGVNKGDGVSYIQIGRFDKVGTSYDGPYGLNDGISFLDNKSYFFNTCGTGGNLPPIVQDASGGGSVCGNTLRICALGDTLVYTTTFLAPELTQSITITGSAPTLGGSFIPLGVVGGSAGLTTYAWMVVASASVAGVHTVVITGTDNGLPPLSSSATYYVKIQNLVVPTPTIVSSPAGTVCAPPGATLTLINCIDYDNVFWSDGTFGCSMVANVSGAYYCTVQKTGCFKSSKDSIVVFPNPAPVVFGPKNYCIPATSTTLSLDPPLPGMAAYTSYTWTAGGINTPTASLTGSLGGTSYTIGVTDANGCVGKSTFSISTQTPTLGITANPLTLCGTGSSTLTASISGATSYLWSNGATTQTTSINISGVHSVTVESNFCVTTQTVNITINPTPTVTIPPIASMCSGSSATVAVTSFSPAGAYTYTWSNGSNSPSQTISTNTILTLFVTNTVTGCKSAISNSCTVLASTNPTVSLSSTPIIFCNGLNATLTPTVTGGTPAYTYTWSPALLGSASTATTNIVGTFTVLVVDQNLCKGTKTVTTVKSSPTAMLSSSDLTICPTECAKIKAVGTSSYSPFTYAWSSSPSIGDSTFACASGVVSFTFTDAQGCESIQTITVVDDIIPVASFTASPPSPVVPGQLITFVNTSSISSGSINPGFWMFGDGGSATGDVVNYAYTGSGTFPVTLYVTSSTGCTDTVMINYVVDALISAPNIITPNGDNVNDFLKFKNLEFFTSNNLTILNRWGTKLLEKENYKNDWNGAGAVDGTYFYILSIPGATPNIYKGFFEVIH